MTRWLSMALAISLAGSWCYAAPAPGAGRAGRASEFRAHMGRHFAGYLAKPRLESLRGLKNAAFPKPSSKREFSESQLAAEAVLRLLASPRDQSAGFRKDLEPVMEPGAAEKIYEAAAELQKAHPVEMENLRRELWEETTDKSNPRLFKKRLTRHLESPAYWRTHQAEILAQAQTLKANMEHYSQILETNLTGDEFQQELDKSKVLFEHSRLGKAEITTIDGNRIVRAVHAPTQLSILFLDKSVSRDSEHLRQFLSRQFFDAGSSREDGKRGRNPVLVWTKDGKVEEALFYEKSKPSELAWWRHYWHATWKIPDRSDFLFGTVMGLLQGVLAGLLSGLKFLMMGDPIAWTPILFTALFGAVVGVLLSTYRNWTYRGHWITRAIKLAVISLVFGYLFTGFTKGFGVLHNPDTHAHIGSNVGVNIWGKTAWAEIPRIGEKHNQFRDPLPFNIKKRSALIHQTFYHINWVFRIADLTGIPWGKLLFIAGIPLAYLLSYWYAKRRGFPRSRAITAKAKNSRPPDLERDAPGLG